MGISRPSLPTGTVTFLFSDIEGSTHLAETLPTDAFRRLLERHNELIRAATAANSGVERGTQGDAFLVIFTETAGAIRAAVEAQLALAAEVWPHGSALRVRMGLHSGSGIAGGDDYVGTDINRAARIAAAAHGGQVLISEATWSLAERQLPPGVSSRDLGSHALKDLARPEHLFQLVIDGIRNEFPPVRSLERSAGNLPLRLTSFVDRETERADVGTLLRSARLVTITGAGGTGKTSLALAVAATVAEAFPDGSWFVPLDGVRDPDLIPAAAARALRLEMEDRRSTTERVIDYLRDRRLLLVFDNLEHLIEGVSFVGSILAECPSVTVLVASQVPLHVTGEQEYPLGPLPSGGGEPLSDRGQELPAALQLFSDRARSVRPSFQLDASNWKAITSICDRLDGLPLAIELAAAQTRFQSPDAILGRLSQRLDLGERRTVDAPDRQRSLTAAVAWSYDLLNPVDRAVLQRLSVFAGGAGLSEIEAISSNVAGVTDPLANLESLVDRSLVRPSPRAADRYDLLETIRSFAAERLRECGDEQGTLADHAHIFVALAEDSERKLYSADRRRWVDRLALDHDNIRAALDLLETTGELEQALRLSASLWRFWQFTGHIDEAGPRIDRLLTRAETFGVAIDPTVMSRAEEAAGGIAYWRRISDDESIEQHYQRSLEYAQASGSRERIAWALYNLSFAYDFVPQATHNQKPDRPRAVGLREEALRIFRTLGNGRGVAYCLWGLAGSPLALADDRPQLIRDQLHEAIGLFREADDAFGETWAWISLSMLEASQGRLDESLAATHTAGRLFAEGGDRSGQLMALEALAAIAAHAGHPALSVRFHAAANAWRTRTGAMAPSVPVFNDPVVAARAQLDDDSIKREELAGESLTFDEALELSVLGGEQGSPIVGGLTGFARNARGVAEGDPVGSGAGAEEPPGRSE